MGFERPCGFVSLRSRDRCFVSLFDALVLFSSFSGSFSVALLLRFLGVLAGSSMSIRRGVTGLAVYGGSGEYPVYAVSGRLVVLPLPNDGVFNPGVIGITVLVGLRGDSGLRSSVTPLRWVGDSNGFCSLESLTGLRPPRKSFFVLNFRARLEPLVIVVGAGVGRSGVGNGYISMM